MSKGTHGEGTGPGGLFLTPAVIEETQSHLAGLVTDTDLIRARASRPLGEDLD